MSLSDESNPYAAPKAQDAPPQPTPRSRVPASAGNLELPIEQRVPPVCLKCASTEKIERREEIFSWSVQKRRSFWLWSSMFGLLGGFGAKLLHRDNDRTAKLSLPLCTSCNGRWSLAKALTHCGWLAVLCVLLFARRWLAPLDVLVVFAAAVGATALMAHEQKKRSLQPLYIDSEIVVLKGGTPLVVERLADARAAEKKAARKPKKRRTLPREADALEDAASHQLELPPADSRRGGS